MGGFCPPPPGLTDFKSPGLTGLNKTKVFRDDNTYGGPEVTFSQNDFYFIMKLYI